MRHLFGMLAMGALTAVAQSYDPYDDQLLVYPLTPDQVAQFSTSDQRVSPFWASAWEDRDHLDLTPGNNASTSGSAFSGDDDAGMVMYAAATCEGLHLYLEASDNVWVDRSSSTDWGSDAMDVYFDELSANEVFTCDACLVGLYSSTLSFSTQQFQVWMGSTSLPTSLRYQHYDETAWSWQDQEVSLADLQATLGIRIEVVAVDATHKVQEWFIPWRSLGNGMTSVPGPGARLAFSGGYNDRDGDNPTAGELRWMGKDPWAEDAKTVNYWGDLVMDASFPATCQMSVRSGIRALGSAPNARGVATYALDGRASQRGASSTPGVRVLRAVDGKCRIAVGVGR